MELTVEQIKNMNNETVLIKESIDCNGEFDNGEHINIDTVKFEHGAWDEVNKFLYHYDVYGKSWIACVINTDGCEECSGVAEMSLPLSRGIERVNYCPMCGRKLIG